MSAWVVSPAHITALVHVAMHGVDGAGWRTSDGPCWDAGPLDGSRHWRRADRTNADDVGRMLYGECIASVHYRYPGDETPDTLPCNDGIIEAESYSYPAGMAFRITLAEALKLISCYEYQSCEHPGWEESEAFRFCRSLESALLTQVPGYESAPWGIDADWLVARQSGRYLVSG